MALRRVSLSIVAAGLLLAGIAPDAVLAEPLDDAALDTTPQYYLMALPPSPVGEVAEAVLGEALGLPYKVDPDVKAEMAFRLDGAYAPKALAKEFGHRLWNVDVALVEKPSDGLWLIPKSELAAAHAEGAVLVAPVVGMTASAPSRTAAPTPSAVVSPPRDGPGWAWLGWLVAGWTAGVGSILVWLRLKAVRPFTPEAPPTRLSLPQPESADPDELVIPVFSETGRR